MNHFPKACELYARKNKRINDNLDAYFEEHPYSIFDDEIRIELTDELSIILANVPVYECKKVDLYIEVVRFGLLKYLEKYNDANYVYEIKYMFNLIPDRDISEPMGITLILKAHLVID